MSGQIHQETLTEALARRLTVAVDADTRARAGLHLVDWLGCAIAGRMQPAAETAAMVRPEGMSGDAFYLGLLGNILEMDDVDKRAILHPGPSIIPAALAMVLSTPDLLPHLPDAIVSGYEATIRLGRATGPGHYSLWHTTGTCGAIGAAAACARLLNLDDLHTAHALSLAMSQATGLWQTRHEPGSMGKQLHTAHAARAGLDSARLASAGFTGPLSVLEGQQGFFAACAPQANPADILKSYDHDWLIHEVSFKPWAACRHAHAAIDAALELHERGLDADQIEKIRVETYADALKFCDKPDPSTTIEAKFSLQHSVAVVLRKGRPEISDFDPAAITKSDNAGLRAKVSVSSTHPYEAAYPARYGAAVTVTLANGRQLAAKAPDALGDPENPLSAEEVRLKAMVLMRHAGMDESSAQGLLDHAGALSGNFLPALREALLS